MTVMIMYMKLWLNYLLWWWWWGKADDYFVRKYDNDDVGITSIDDDGRNAHDGYND
jgi:hypothetical protein